MKTIAEVECVSIAEKHPENPTILKILIQKVSLSVIVRIRIYRIRGLQRIAEY